MLIETPPTTYPKIPVHYSRTMGGQPVCCRKVGNLGNCSQSGPDLPQKADGTYYEGYRWCGRCLPKVKKIVALQAKALTKAQEAATINLTPETK